MSDTPQMPASGPRIAVQTLSGADLCRDIGSEIERLKNDSRGVSWLKKTGRPKSSVMPRILYRRIPDDNELVGKIDSLIKEAKDKLLAEKKASAIVQAEYGKRK